ncbi:MAG: MFS transporter, partial [Candidatus Dormibacteria bacterium]
MADLIPPQPPLRGSGLAPVQQAAPPDLPSHPPAGPADDVPLWRHPGFSRLWAAQGVSRLGSEVTGLALPTVAIVLLGAGPLQIGFLNALEMLSFLVLGLVAGVIADRVRRRRLMVMCDLLRLITIGSIPVAHSLGWLSLGQLYVVALLTGVATVFFDVAYQSYLPALIPRHRLVEGNTRLGISESVAHAAGPALGGLLINLAG